MWLREETQQKGLDGDGFGRRLASLSRRPSCCSQSAWSALTFHWPSEIVGCLPSQNRLLSWWEPILIKQETHSG